MRPTILLTLSLNLLTISPAIAGGDTEFDTAARPPAFAEGERVASERLWDTGTVLGMSERGQVIVQFERNGVYHRNPDDLVYPVDCTERYTTKLCTGSLVENTLVMGRTNTPGVVMEIFPASRGRNMLRILFGTTHPYYKLLYPQYIRLRQPQE